MPVHQILLSTATASVVVAASAVSMSAQDRLTVSATVVVPCSISVQEPTLQPSDLETVSVDCASPTHSTVRANNPAAADLRSNPLGDIAAPQESANENTAEVVNVIF